MPGPDLTSTASTIANRAALTTEMAHQNPSDYRSPQDMKDAKPEHVKGAAEDVSHLSDKQVNSPKVKTRGSDYSVARDARN